MKDSRGDDRQLIECRLLKLIEAVDLESGDVTVKIHQGTVAQVDIIHHVKLRFDPRSPDRTHPGDKETEALVVGEIMPLVCSMLGEYGCVAATVHKGNVQNYTMEHNWKGGDNSFRRSAPGNQDDPLRRLATLRGRNKRRRRGRRNRRNRRDP